MNYLLKITFTILTGLTLCGCQAWQADSYTSYLQRENDRRIQTISELEEKAKSLALGKVLWLKPKSNEKCDYEDSLKAFTEVTVEDISVSPAQTEALNTYWIKFQLKSKKDDSSTSAKFISYGNGIGQEDLANCFYDLNPKKHFKMASGDWKLIEKGHFRIGFSKEQLSLSLGEPSSINRTGSAGMITEQWVYGSNRYFYFTNGKLKSWQD